MRIGKKDMSWEEPFNQSLALASYIKAGDCRPQKIEENWHRTFSCVAKYLGFSKSSRKILWEELVEGNWERLHTTEEEKKMTPEEWLYRQYKWALFRMGEVDYV